MPGRPAFAPTASTQDKVYDAFAAKLAESEGLQGRRRQRAGRGDRPADRRAGDEEGREPRRRRDGQGGQGGARRKAARERRAVFRAHRDHRSDAGNAGVVRGDFRAGRAAVALHRRSGSDPPRQQHRVRSGGLFLLARHRAHLPCRRADGNRDGVRELRDPLDRDRAVWRVKQSGLGREGRSTVWRNTRASSTF